MNAISSYNRAMKQFLQLLSVTIATWAVHVVFVTSYSKLFTNTHSLLFRAIYALELTSIFSVVLWLYLTHTKQVPSLAVLLASVIGFLAIVDLALSLTVASVHKTFDAWHFIVAYSLLTGSLIIIYKRFVNVS